jgi:aspartate 1-decarboxylase
MAQQAIANDPRANLSAYISLAPSKEALMQLSGQMASYMQKQSDPVIAATYISCGEFAVSAEAVRSNPSLSSCIRLQCS